MKTFLKRRVPFLILVTVLIASALFIRSRRNLNPNAISPSGGEAFRDFSAVQTPIYLQTDTRWRDVPIGGSSEKLSNVGCTLCCLAMGLENYAIDLTPPELNELLKSADGFTKDGLIKWESVSKISDGKVRVDHSSPLSFQTIDQALTKRQPVIAKIFLNGLAAHWVLIVGKEGMEYLVCDPLGDGESLDKLSDYKSDIHAIRVIKLAN
jgi:hypothetical protein